MSLVRGRAEAAKGALRHRLIDDEYLAAAYALLKARSELYPFQGTDLVIEGFPRSANTFLVSALRMSNPQYVYASHLHGLGSLKRSIRAGTPAVVLIREPTAAVVSLCIREGTPIAKNFAWYRDYYRAIRRMADSLCLLAFEVVTGDTQRAFDAISAYSGLHLRPAPVTTEELALVKIMVETSETRFSGRLDPMKVAAPSDERKSVASAMLSAISANELLRILQLECEEEYAAVASLCRR